MDINLRNQYLGQTSEPIHKAQLKVIIGFMFICLSTGFMITEELGLIKHHYRVGITKVKSKAKRIRKFKLSTE